MLATKQLEGMSDWDQALADPVERGKLNEQANQEAQEARERENDVSAAARARLPASHEPAPEPEPVSDWEGLANNLS